jgi:rubrerythrin
MTHTRNDAINWEEMSIEDILELAISDEIFARDYYRHAADLTGNLHTRRMLLELSTMEQGHADALQKELDELHVQRDLETGIAD